MKLSERIKRSYFFYKKLNSIPLFWHDCGGVKNFGDELNPYLVKKITSKPIFRVKFIPRRFSFFKINLVIGSIASGANKNCNVWGSGVISKNAPMHQSNYYAVRGPRTIKRMKELGLTPPKSIGDPALLIEKYYNLPKNTKFKYGIVPHYTEIDLFNNLELPKNAILIRLTDNVEEVIDQIRSCEQIISSSLHGLIVANCYDIQTTWVNLSDRVLGDGTKFYDYFESVDISDPKCYNLSPKELVRDIDINKFSSFCPSKKVINELQESLLLSCPFI